MVMPCSRSASSPSTSSAKSIASSVVPNFFESLFERRELVVEDELLLVEKPPDERRLAVVDRAAGEDAQGRKRGNAKRGVHDSDLLERSAHRPRPRGAMRGRRREGCRKIGIATRRMVRGRRRSARERPSRSAAWRRRSSRTRVGTARGVIRSTPRASSSPSSPPRRYRSGGPAARRWWTCASRR